jgi:hypothetical protein
MNSTLAFFCGGQMQNFANKKKQAALSHNGYCPRQSIRMINIQHAKLEIKKIELLHRGQNPLSYYILYNESEHNILAMVGKANKCWLA